MCQMRHGWTITRIGNSCYVVFPCKDRFPLFRVVLEERRGYQPWLALIAKACPLEKYFFLVFPDITGLQKIYFHWMLLMIFCSVFFWLLQWCRQKLSNICLLKKKLPHYTTSLPPVQKKKPCCQMFGKFFVEKKLIFESNKQLNCAVPSVKLCTEICNATTCHTKFTMYYASIAFYYKKILQYHRKLAPALPQYYTTSVLHWEDNELPNASLSEVQRIPPVLRQYLSVFYPELLGAAQYSPVFCHMLLDFFTTAELCTAKNHAQMTTYKPGAATHYPGYNLKSYFQLGQQKPTTNHQPLRLTQKISGKIPCMMHLTVFFMIDNVKFARLQQPSNFSQFSDTLWITFLQPDKSYHSICLQNLIRFKNNRRQVRFAPNMTSRHPIPPNALPPKKHVQSFENDLTCSTEKQNWVFENFYWRHWKKSYGMGKVPRLPDQNCKIEAWYCKKHDVIFFFQEGCHT